MTDSIFRVTRGLGWLLTRMALSALMLSLALQAPAASDPQQFIKSVIDKVVAQLRSDPKLKSGDQAAIEQYITTELQDKVDTRRMTASAVGRGWRDASEEQKRELETQFRRLVIRTYSTAFKHAQEDFELSFQPMRQEEGAKDVIVRSTIKTKSSPEPVQVDYRMTPIGDSWRIYDVNVMGVWLVQNYRTSFNEEIQKGGVNGLIKSLTAKNEQPASAPKPGAGGAGKSMS